MQAIATLLNPSAHQKTLEPWQALEKTCGLSGIKIPNDPHLSWFVAEKFDESAVKQEFSLLARELEAYEIYTSGIGLFTGERPILYIPVVKTKLLLDVHEKIWNSLSRYGENLSDVYRPENWIPHVTITSDDSSLIDLGCILSALMHLDLKMTIPVNNLALIYSEESSAGINFVQSFKKGES